MAEYYFALTDINNAIDRLIHACPTTFYNGLQAARNIFSKDLAADVVPVVRCKDCRYIHTGQDTYYCRYWERWGITPNGFCSSVAKMDGEA